MSKTWTSHTKHVFAFKLNHLQLIFVTIWETGPHKLTVLTDLSPHNVSNTWATHAHTYTVLHQMSHLRGHYIDFNSLP